MEETRYKKPPFELKRTMRGGLAEQLAAEFRRAIQTGYYRPGDMLPPVREQTALLKVSRVVVVRAMAMLAEERLVHPRPHYGCEVCSRDKPLWKGQVLIVVPPGATNQHLDIVACTLRDALTASGYLVLTATVPHVGGDFDFSLLDVMLGQNVDMAVQLHDQREISLHLARAKVPYVRFTRSEGRLPRGCVGAVRFRMDARIPDFVAHCRERNVRSVLQVVASKYAMDAVPALRKAGIAASEWQVPAVTFPMQPGPEVARLTAAAFEERLAAQGRAWLPEVLFFTDDFVAMGAMSVLSDAGVRTPRDVGVVTWANRDCGCGPVFAHEPTRMEGVAGDDGRCLACAVLDYLKSGRFTPVEIVPMYIRGETFR